MISFPVILLRLAVAIVLGASVGLEREIHEHSAGIRTVALVTLGCALFTIISAYGFLDLLGLLHVTLDPTRIASYIVAGIGFLGAGTIFMSRESERVKGLTTAASIWVMAAIGMACGAGLLAEAIVTTVLVLIVLVGLRYVEQLILPRGRANSRHIQIEADAVTGQLMASIYETCAASQVTIEKLRIDTAQSGEIITMLCQADSAPALGNAIGSLHELPGVRAIHAKLGPDNNEMAAQVNRERKGR
ncbi:MAG TPA: MgtC/SapB family protein [Ktedonobacteraceae bacterium]|nr:MgtC/SapB family protein [Ktedonobacteraceae bacterium]